MGALRLAIAVLALGYIVSAYHHVIADIGGSTNPTQPLRTSSLELRSMNLSGCAVTLGGAQGSGGCPAQQSQGVIPANE